MAARPPITQASIDSKLPLSGGAITGPITATQANGVTAPRLDITNNNVDLNYDKSSVRFSNAASGIGVSIKNTSSGWGLGISTTGSGRGIDVNAGAASSGRGVAISNNGSGDGLYVYNNGSGFGLNLINSAAATRAAFAFATSSTANAAAYGGYGVDAVGCIADLLKLSHYGAVRYGVDLSNLPGAASAAVIHQYSQLAGESALRVDNCGTQTALTIWNTENTSIAPGQLGTGRFVDLWARPTSGAALANVFYVAGDGAVVLVPKAAPPATLADGMLWMQTDGHLYARLAGATVVVK